MTDIYTQMDEMWPEDEEGGPRWDYKQIPGAGYVVMVWDARKLPGEWRVFGGKLLREACEKALAECDQYA